LPSDGRQTLGKAGENLACEELVRRGYAILERQYCTRYGEIDIIARVKDPVIFVEVKTRAGDHYGGGHTPEAAADHRGRARLTDATALV
jgi:putative endonuclease